MNTVKLIVYGTLMSGEGNHRFSRNAVSIFPCTVTGTLHDTGRGFPALVQEVNTAVKAELIEIPLADWADIDRLEGYPRLYDRLLLQVTFADGSETTGLVYIMNNLPEGAKVISSGDWRGRHG